MSDQPMGPDERLRPYATDKQWEYYAAYVEHGGYGSAAKALGVHLTTVREAINAVRKRAAQHGYAPEQDLTHESAPGFLIRGTSILYDGEDNIAGYWNKTKLEGRDPAETVQLPDPKKIIKRSTLYDQAGNVQQQWVAEKPSDEARGKLWQSYAEQLAAAYAVPVAPTVYDHTPDERSLLGIPVGDHHFGMLSWAAETGEDYDLGIAEDVLKRATDRLIAAAPPCKRCVLAFLGDLLHYDSMKPVTPTHGYILDADSRFPKMVGVAVRTIRWMVTRALERSEYVHIIVVPGNHDLSTSVMLRLMLATIYEHEPRVTVDNSPSHFHYFHFGRNLIGTYHGHDVKLDKLPLIMAHDRPELWGVTEHRVVWTGHVHHEGKEEFPGCVVERFPVLATLDAHAHQKGYRSKRKMMSIVFDHDHGERERYSVNPSMLA